MSEARQPSPGLLEKIRSLPPELAAEIEDFVDFLSTRESGRSLVAGASSVSEAAFQSVWDNPEDGDYDRL